MSEPGSVQVDVPPAVREKLLQAALRVDEIQKALRGGRDSAQFDGGTTSRVFGTFLTWLQEKARPVFVVATANDIQSLPPELHRKGRFDEIFFVDLPDARAREEIFRIHVQRRGRDPRELDLVRPAGASEGFSGSEIEEAVVAGLFEAFYGKPRSNHRDEIPIRTLPASAKRWPAADATPRQNRPAPESGAPSPATG